jgi:hypothetical protein
MIRIILKGVVYNIHKHRTRYNNNLHPPTVNLSELNKDAYFSERKVFNHLMEYIKNLPNDWKCFTSTLKWFLYQQSFYLIEYFKYKENRKIWKAMYLYSKCININKFLKSHCYMRLY